MKFIQRDSPWRAIVNKLIQGGGTTRTLRKGKEAIGQGALCIFMTQSLNKVLEDAYYKAVNEIKINEDDIIFHQEVKEIIPEHTNFKGKLIIASKHPTYCKVLAQVILLARADEIPVVFVWDEYDTDCAGYEFISGSVKKDINLNALSEAADYVYCVSATNFAGVLTDWEWNEVIDLSVGREYLGFEDLEFFTVTKEHLEELTCGNITPAISTFLKDRYSEGVLIRVDRERAKHEDMKENIEKQLNLKATIINTDNNDVSPRDVKGILIANGSVPRAITLPSIHHEIVAFSGETPQNTIIQSLRILGYGKKLKTKNYILCDETDKQKLIVAHKVDKDIREKNILKQSKKERDNWLKTYEFPNGFNAISRDKNNHYLKTGVKHEKLSPLFKNLAEDIIKGMDVPILDSKITQKKLEQLTKRKNAGAYEGFWTADILVSNVSNTHPQQMVRSMERRKYIPIPDYINGNYVKAKRGNPNQGIWDLSYRSKFDYSSAKAVATLNPNGTYNVWHTLNQQDMVRLNSTAYTHERDM